MWRPAGLHAGPSGPSKVMEVFPLGVTPEPPSDEESGKLDLTGCFSEHHFTPVPPFLFGVNQPSSALNASGPHSPASSYSTAFYSAVLLA